MAPSLLVLMAFTILLIPVALLGGLVLAGMAAYGWVALGLVAGRWVLVRLHQQAPPVRAAIVGTALVTLIVNALGIMPLVGVMTAGVAVTVALGAVLLTGFGTRVFVPTTAAEGP